MTEQTIRPEIVDALIGQMTAQAPITNWSEEAGSAVRAELEYAIAIMKARGAIFDAAVSLGGHVVALVDPWTHEGEPLVTTLRRMPAPFATLADRLIAVSGQLEGIAAS
jgi:hypothetical protein